MWAIDLPGDDAVAGGDAELDGRPTDRCTAATCSTDATRIERVQASNELDRRRWIRPTAGGRRELESHHLAGHGRLVGALAPRGEDAGAQGHASGDEADHHEEWRQHADDLEEDVKEQHGEPPNGAWKR